MAPVTERMTVLRLMRYLATFDPETTVFMHVGGSRPYRDIDLSMTDAQSTSSVILNAADAWTPDGFVDIHDKPVRVKK